MTRFRHKQTDTSKVVRVVSNGNSFSVSIDETTVQVSAVEYRDGIMYFTLDGQRHRIPIADANGQIFLAIDGCEYRLEKVTTRHASPTEAHKGSTVDASMPGTIRAVYVTSGDKVEEGTPIILMEAMKMEIRLTAPRDGTVKTVHVQVGQLVQQNDVLVELT